MYTSPIQVENIGDTNYKTYSKGTYNFFKGTYNFDKFQLSCCLVACLFQNFVSQNVGGTEHKLYLIINLEQSKKND